MHLEVLLRFILIENISCQDGPQGIISSQGPCDCMFKGEFGENPNKQEHTESHFGETWLNYLICMFWRRLNVFLNFMICFILIIIPANDILKAWVFSLTCLAHINCIVYFSCNKYDLHELYELNFVYDMHDLHDLVKLYYLLDLFDFFFHYLHD